MKNTYIDPMAYWAREASFKADTVPQRLHEDYSAAEVEAFRERQKNNYRNWMPRR